MSMEGDFSNFLEYIAEFQKTPGISTLVWVLGDLTEMWEARASIENFIFRKPQDLYKGLQQVIEWLRKSIKAENEMERFLQDLYKLKIAELPCDSLFETQIASLANDKNELEKIYIADDESGESLKTKAKYIEEEILKKYTNASNKHFGDLLADIGWKIRIHGNHDNFSLISSLEPVYNCLLSGFSPPAAQFPSNYGQNMTDYLIMHGHNIDQHNNDESCGTGYFIVKILNLFEAKKRGDLLKKFESAITGDAHLNYIKRIAPILYEWDSGNNQENSKNKVVVQAHTHLPYLEDITNQYLIYKYVKSAVPKTETVVKNWKIILEL